jgi:hypothetical protein
LRISTYNDLAIRTAARLRLAFFNTNDLLSLTIMGNFAMQRKIFLALLQLKIHRPALLCHVRLLKRHSGIHSLPHIINRQSRLNQNPFFQWFLNVAIAMAPRMPAAPRGVKKPSATERPPLMHWDQIDRVLEHA